MRDKPWKCPKCGNEFPLSEHVIMNGCIGKQTPIHECGDGFVKVRLSPRSRDAKAFWNRVAGFVKNLKP